MINALTIDVEDYFQVHAFSKVIQYENWGDYKCRIEQNTDRILNILNRASHNSKLINHKSKIKTHNSVKGTFFVLGWIAERYPDLIRRIKDEGHEISCHGYAHKVIYRQTKEEFRQDVRRAKALLEDITGAEVIGYRAPIYSITNESQWALKILMEEGFKYDSSIFPIHHDFYGIPNAPRFPFIIFLDGDSDFEFLMLNSEPESPVLSSRYSELLPCAKAAQIEIPKFTTHNSKFIIEFPVSTMRLLGQNFPISGGGYFRLFPYSVIKRSLKKINEEEGEPFIFYIHPWEIDSDQPRIQEANLKSQFRHYINLQKTEDKFKKLLNEFNFAPVKEVLELNNLFTKKSELQTSNSEFLYHEVLK